MSLYAVSRSAISANDYAAEALRVLRSQSLDWAFVLDRQETVGRVYLRDLETRADGVLKNGDVREFMRPLFQ